MGDPPSMTAHRKARLTPKRRVELAPSASAYSRSRSSVHRQLQYPLSIREDYYVRARREGTVGASSSSTGAWAPEFSTTTVRPLPRPPAPTPKGWLPRPLAISAATNAANIHATCVEDRLSCRTPAPLPLETPAWTPAPPPLVPLPWTPAPSPLEPPPSPPPLLLEPPSPSPSPPPGA